MKEERVISPGSAEPVRVVSKFACMKPPPRQPSRAPEILAPAGDQRSLQAALQGGADAVYFGLDEGFNARQRAENFSLDGLASTVSTIHSSGARAFLTLNTLVFEPELEAVERVVRAAALAGVDALIVQDPAVALLARAICPALHLHASTQMTVSSPEAARFAQTLGVTRIVVPRELSVDEIRKFAAGTDLELEVFIVGALCVSWSGQCLSSEVWGGRSANRGQCAQACRLPYDLIVDGERRDLGDVAYLLSPRDLAGFGVVRALMDLGVAGLKIEGRQKGPAYVLSATTAVRGWVDAQVRGVKPEDEKRLSTDLRDLSLAYSRGWSEGWLAGSDHQALVEGRSPRHRGLYLGRVESVEGNVVRVASSVSSASSVSPACEPSDSAPAQPPAVAPLEPVCGMGVVFDEGRPEEEEQGGPLFSVRRQATGWLLGFGRPGPDLRRVRAGARVWVTGDPALAAAAQRAVTSPLRGGRVGLCMTLRGRAGEPLLVQGRTSGAVVEVVSDTVLQPSRVVLGGGLSADTLRDKLGALGGSPFVLEELDARELAEGLFLPVSELKRLRRVLVAELSSRLGPPPRVLTAGSQIEPLRERLAELSGTSACASAADAAELSGTSACASAADLARSSSSDETLSRVSLNRLPESRSTGADCGVRLVALCRTDEQLEAVIERGGKEVVLDWMEMVGLGRAVARARSCGLRVGVATVRVQKPGEEGYDRRLEALAPDAVLVRHWAACMHFASVRARKRTTGSPGRHGRVDEDAPLVHGDFSLNVTNSLTAMHLLGLGLDTLTVSYDLDELQLFALLERVPPSRIAVTVHHHIPTFHTEHCVYASTLSQGRDFRTCGRPCEEHQIALRDRVGLSHPVIVDVGCRNTVFNAQAQSAAGLVERLVRSGVRLLRVEFVRESREEAVTVLDAYGALLAGEIGPEEVVRRAGAHEQFGVTRGTMQVTR